MLVCQDFDFCKDFVSIKKEGGGQEIQTLRSATQANRT